MRLARVGAGDGCGYRIGSSAVGVVNGMKARSITETEGESMKAVLEFVLPEEQEQFEEAANGTRWRCVVQELDRKMRDVQKHEKNRSAAREAFFWRDELADVLKYHNLSMYD